MVAAFSAEELAEAAERLKGRSPRQLSDYVRYAETYARPEKIKFERGAWAGMYYVYRGGFPLGSVRHIGQAIWIASMSDPIEGNPLRRASIGEAKSRDGAARLLVQRHLRREAAGIAWAKQRLASERPEVLAAEDALDKLSKPEALRLLDAYAVKLGRAR